MGAPCEVVVAELLERCSACDDGSCLICRADWYELARRIAGIEMEVYVEHPPIVCAHPGCNEIVQRPREAGQRFCSDRCRRRSSKAAWNARRAARALSEGP